MKDFPDGLTKRISEAQELKLILSQLPVTLEEDDIDAMLRAGDADGNGMFDLAEMGWVIAKKASMD